MAERSHLSIGEVLSLLRDEFPDVTISKIRFLESQGLVDPERTPSGYRKFYDHDVERLRWILRQQREHFLPLKVIRGRLTEQESGEVFGSDAAALDVHDSDEANADGTDAERMDDGGMDDGGNGAGEAPKVGPARTARRPAPPVTGERREAAARATPATPATPSLFADLHKDQPAGAGSAPARAEPAPASAPEPRSGGARPVQAASHQISAVPTTAGDHDEAESYTVEELASAVGAESTFVQELKQYGLISSHAVVGGVSYYDASALTITRSAAEFSRHGVEARHLRPWRNSADREADLFQQVVLPLLRQRNPQARRQALDTLAELAAAGAALRAALVERAIREIR